MYKQGFTNESVIKCMIHNRKCSQNLFSGTYQ